MGKKNDPIVCDPGMRSTNHVFSKMDGNGYIIALKVTS